MRWCRRKESVIEECGLFPEADIDRLDALQETLFKCFEEDSIVKACHQFRLAKLQNEPCPFSQDDLDRMFAKEK